jgi:hypothetical protein
MALMRRNRR